MANSRIARFFLEVAPPQYVTVMRHRTSKMLETITEEDRELSPNDCAISSSKSSSAAAAASASLAASASTSSTTATAHSRCFLKGVHRSLSILNH